LGRECEAYHIQEHCETCKLRIRQRPCCVYMGLDDARGAAVAEICRVFRSGGGDHRHRIRLDDGEHEYFAFGMPVVSTPISFMQECGDLVYTGSTVEELTAAISMALAEPLDSPKRAERLSFAQRNGNTIEQVSRFLAPLFAESDQFPPAGWNTLSVPQSTLQEANAVRAIA